MEDAIAGSSKALDSGGEDSVDTEPETNITESKPKNMSSGAVKLRSWLNKTLRIEMSDGRILIGVFLCTDRDANVILGTCSEYLPEETEKTDEIFPSSNHTLEEPRMLGLVMVPGKHIMSICIDHNEFFDGGQMRKLSLGDVDIM